MKDAFKEGLRQTGLFMTISGHAICTARLIAPTNEFNDAPFIFGVMLMTIGIILWRPFKNAT